MKKKHKPYNFLITAGATREFIDPVRFISNASTGKIGYLLAEGAKKQGNNVVLLSGQTYLQPPRDVKTFIFQSALELKGMVNKHFQWADCIISTAAVGDYRPIRVKRQKIKKNKVITEIKLSKNPDILKELGKKKGEKILVGFSLETEDLIANSKKKFKLKNLDLIVANKLSNRSVPFGMNQVTAFIIDKEKVLKYEKISKKMLARIILDRVMKLCYIQKNQKKGGKQC